MERLARALRHAGAAGFPPSPYKFLEHYQVEDAAFFFGRDAEVAELAAAVEARPVRLLMVFGPCGIGKSSLIRAGLVPALAARGFAPLSITSGADPAGRVGAALEQHRPGSRVVLIVDQVEELFTHNPPGAPLIARFFEAISELVERPGDAPKIVLSFRSEFRSDLFPLETRLASHAHLHAVSSMTERGLVEAIVGPSHLEHYGFSYAPGLPDRLALDILKCTDERGQSSSSLLQIACRQLYDRAREQGVRVIDGTFYEKTLEGVRGALQRYVEERLTGPGYGADAPLARQIIRALTVREDGGERFARARDEQELLDFPDRARAGRILERLVDDRLVAREESSPGQRVVRLASEVICPLVDRWTLEVDEAERAARIVARASRQWTESGRRGEDLLTGAALTLVEQQRPALRSLPPEATALLDASIRARLNRRLGFDALAASIGLLIGVSLWVTMLAPGRIHIASDPPGARVLMPGGELLGTTPLSLLKRPAVYQLTLRKARHGDTALTVRVPPGGEATYAPVLPYPYGILALGTDPAGARCEVVPERPAGGSVLTTTAPFHAELAAGRYSLRLSAKGCVPMTVTGVEIPGNRQLVDRLARLERDTGWLEVETPFAGAEMTARPAAGQQEPWAATLPMNAREIVCGPYELEVRRVDHHSRTLSLAITRATTTVVTAWPPPVRTLWRFSDGDYMGMAPEAVDVDRDGVPDVLTLGKGRRLRAFSGRTGAQVLATTLDVTATRTGPAISLHVTDLDGDRRPDALLRSQTGFVSAVDAATGRCRLEVAFEAAEIDSDPAFADLDGDGGADLISVGGGRLAAVSGRTGRVMWAGGCREKIARVVLADVDVDGFPDVVAATTGAAVEVRSGSSGRPLWRADPLAPHQTSVELAATDLDGDRSADVVVSDSRQVVALSGRSGRLLWRAPVDTPTDLRAARLAGRTGLDVLVASNLALTAFDGATGRRLWRVPGASWFDELVVADLDRDGRDDVLVKRKEERLEAYRGRDGHLLWSVSGTLRQLSRPIVADLDHDGVPDVVRQTPERGLVATSGAAGEIPWTFHPPGQVSGTPVAVDLDRDGKLDVVICSNDPASSRVQAVSGASGRELWRRSLAGASWPLATAGDLDGDRRPELVVVDQAGGIRALEGATGKVLWTGPKLRPMAVPLVADPDGDGRCDVYCLLRHPTNEARHLVAALSGRDGQVLWQTPEIPPIQAVPLQVVVPPGGGRPLIAVLAPGMPPGGLLAEEPTTPEGFVVRVILADGATGKVRGVVESTLRITGPVNYAVADLDGDGATDIVVSVARGGVQALSGQAGRLLWAAPAPDRMFLGGVAARPDDLALTDVDRDGTPDVIAMATSGRAVALSGRNGSPLWQGMIVPWPYSRSVLGPIDGDDVPDLLAVTSKGRLVALSGRTGQRLPLSLESSLQNVALVVDLQAGPGPFTEAAARGPLPRRAASKEARLLHVGADSTVMLSRLEGLLSRGPGAMEEEVAREMVESSFRGLAVHSR
ncbi:MAG: PQQ-binding-like beta-propeller repeat protein [Candidatus Riflebacteria bacterium]|nr:PQQ-binding-like beta-propeller repeat protein [Candidatus Riflebacteria bacterium]